MAKELTSVIPSTLENLKKLALWYAHMLAHLQFSHGWHTDTPYVSYYSGLYISDIPKVFLRTHKHFCALACV